MDVDLNLLRTFVAVADAGGFSAAARTLHLSQPAVHTQVKRLTDQLGVTLYVRSGRGVVLTSAGEEVAACGRELLLRTRVLRARLEGRGEPVVLAAGRGALLSVLGDGLGEAVRTSEVPPRLWVATAPEAVAAVRAGRADVGVGAGLEGLPGLESLVVKTLAVLDTVVALPIGHSLTALRGPNEPLTPEDLAGSALVVPSSGRPHRAAIARLLDTRGVPWTVAVEANDWDLALHFVGLGLGLAVVHSACRLPPGVAVRALPALPGPRYATVHRAGPVRAEVAHMLEALHGSRNRVNPLH